MSASAIQLTTIRFQCNQNVEFVEEFEDDCYYEHYKIFVIADGMTTELLDVYGTDGNGYYGTGYTIDVYLPDED